MNTNWVLKKKKVINLKSCGWWCYDEFCCRDLDGGRVWDWPPKRAFNKKVFYCEYYKEDKK